MAWVRPSDSKPGFAWLSIPGSALDRLDETLLAMLFHLLDTGVVGSDDWHTILRNWRATRIDTAIDDFEKKIRPADILFFAEKGDFSGFRHKPQFDTRSNSWLPPSYSFQSSPSCDSEGNVLLAGTLYFGSPQSDKRLYIYDKFLESNGEVDSVRWEARWVDDYARDVFKKICLCFFDETVEISVSVCIAAITTSAIDFIDRFSGDRVSRCSRLSFWQEIIDCVGRTKLSLPRILVTIEKTVSWLSHQVETSFAVLESIFGFEDFINAILRLRDHGFTRLYRSHQRIIEQAKKDGFDLHKYLDLILNND